ncbi:MAG: hypothetical protein H6852_04215 [Geminicoccaceae bacterium]|jgi:hypothetical protein|nr:hypothetical protein [Geminicoccaceae bacterium]MCB9966831.1 hypothetical protein [Geminicoccaceae bacterium]HRY25736.1 hypothetical protein [Geminicoccaceae bacterium]
MARSVRRAAGMFSLGFAMVALAGCSGGPESLPIDAYLAPPPLWRGLPPPAPVPDLARNVELVGMDSGDLRSVFGEPALVRVEGNVQYWRYAFAGCSLDLFVDARPDRQAEVVHYDLRPEPLYGNGKAAAGCERLARQLDQGQKRAAPQRELPRVESF